MWVTALALFAVSALHLGGFHGTSESCWPSCSDTTRRFRWHSRFCIRTIRFAFADLFLKRALTLLVVVTARLHRVVADRRVVTRDDATSVCGRRRAADAVDRYGAAVSVAAPSGSRRSSIGSC